MLRVLHHYTLPAGSNILPDTFNAAKRLVEDFLIPVRRYDVCHQLTTMSRLAITETRQTAKVMQLLHKKILPTKLLDTVKLYSQFCPRAMEHY